MRYISWKQAVLLSGVLGTTASPVLAAGLPQLDPANFAPQLIWLAISFLALYLLMSRVALPRITEVLEKRQTRIEGNLERAEALKAEAEATLEAYEKALAEGRQAAQAVISEARDKMAAESAARHASLGEKLAGEVAAAEKRIDDAKNAALADLRDMAGEVANEATQRLTGLSPDEKAVSAALESILKERG
ncbi:MAG: F0F1 ATP synthase subunit B' [Rhodospirillales bacterium]|nr:F0F1 ATP synthase subunit B' [Rhodospirillales bacterium]